MKAVIAYLRWWWSTRNCRHPRVRRINGDERNHGYGWRCIECGGPTNEHTPQVVRDHAKALERRVNDAARDGLSFEGIEAIGAVQRLNRLADDLERTR